MVWVLNHLEPAEAEAIPSRLWWQGQAYRRRRQHRTTLATFFGPVVVWRRLYEPLARRGRSLHPLERRLGIEAGGAPPALAERLGSWAAEHPQHQVLEMLAADHGVHWSCSTLRKLLSTLSTGMGAQRHGAQVAQVVHWLAQARASQGHWQPTLSVGRDGVNVPLRHGAWKEGATATVSVLDHRGKRVGTVYLGHMPASGQRTVTTPLTALIQDILKQVDSQSLRLVYVSDDGYHPSDYYHRVLKRCPIPSAPGALSRGYALSTTIMPVCTSSSERRPSLALHPRARCGPNRCASTCKPNPMGSRGSYNQQGPYGGNTVRRTRSRMMSKPMPTCTNARIGCAIGTLRASIFPSAPVSRKRLVKRCSPSASSARACRGRSRAAKSSWTFE
jgi:hypothetical protein